MYKPSTFFRPFSESTNQSFFSEPFQKVQTLHFSRPFSENMIAQFSFHNIIETPTAQLLTRLEISFQN